MARDTQKIMQDRLRKEKKQYKQELDNLIRSMDAGPYKSPDQADFYEAEIERLKAEIERLAGEISRLSEENAKYHVKNPRGAGRKPKLCREQIEQVRRLRREGRTIAAIAKEYSCSPGLIHKLIHEDN